MVNLSVTAFLLFFCLLSSYVNCPDPGEIDRMVCNSNDELIKSVITCQESPRGRSRSRSPSTKRSRSVSKRGSSKEGKPVTRQTLARFKRVGDQPFDTLYGIHGPIVFAKVNPLRAPMHEGKRLVEIVQADKLETPIQNTIEVVIKYCRDVKMKEMKNTMILAHYGFGPAVILARRTESPKPLLPKTFLMVKRVKGVTLEELFSHILQAAYTGPLPVTPDLLTEEVSVGSFIAGLQILELQRVVLERVKELISNTKYRHCGLTWGNIMIEQQTETQDLPVTAATDLDSVLRWKLKNIIFRTDGKSDAPIILDQANIQFIDPYYLEEVRRDSSYPCVSEETGEQRSDVRTVGLWTKPDYVKPLETLPHGKVLKFINELFPRNSANIPAGDEKKLVDILISQVEIQKETEIMRFSKLEHNRLPPESVLKLL